MKKSLHKYSKTWYPRLFVIPGLTRNPSSHQKMDPGSEAGMTVRQRWIPAGVYPVLCYGAGVTIIMLFFSFWLMFHTFGYDGKNHNILIASKLWSDFGSHIPLIRSFSLGDNFDLLLKGKPQYPIYPGEPMRYHFLFYALVGLLERLGIRIDWALNIPSALGFFFLLFFTYRIAKKLFSDTRVAVLSVIFFLFNGSLAFLRFFELHPLSKNTLSDIRNASAFPAFAPWGPGEVSAFWNLNIYTNQRHLAAGFSIALFFIFTILQISFARPGLAKLNLRWAIVWGVIIGILPYFHTPTLVIMAILFASYFLFFPKVRGFLLLAGLIASLLVIPQLLTFPQGPQSISWYPGYLIHDQLTVLRFLQYWWNNLGLHSILIPIGFFFIPNRAKKILAPIFVIFLGANLFKFSVEVAGSHKFFNFVLILGNMISAYTVIFFLKQCNNIAIKQLRKPLVIIVGIELIGLLTLSGLIDFFVVANDSKGTIADIYNSEAATWILKNTPPSSVFLNSSYLYHPASLAGRKIFLGWPYFAWSAGYDSYKRFKDMTTMYETTNVLLLCNKLKEYHINYITFDTNKQISEINFNEETLRDNFQLVYSNSAKTLHIYKTQNTCL